MFWANLTTTDKHDHPNPIYVFMHLLYVVNVLFYINNIVLDWSNAWSNSHWSQDQSN